MSLTTFTTRAAAASGSKPAAAPVNACRKAEACVLLTTPCDSVPTTSAKATLSRTLDSEIRAQSSKVIAGGIAAGVVMSGMAADAVMSGEAAGTSKSGPAAKGVSGFAAKALSARAARPPNVIDDAPQGSRNSSVQIPKRRSWKPGSFNSSGEQVHRRCCD